MTSRRAKTRLSLERLEDRLALSAVASTPAQVANTLAELTAFTKAYQSHPGEANYNPALDLNHNNQIAQVDGVLLLHALPPLSPNIPLGLDVAVAPQVAARGSHGTVSGGATFNKTPTILGRTTPGALIFTGTGTVDLKLRGPAYVANAQGDFSVKLNLTAGINQFDLKVVDAYGHQTLRAFPILWLGFGKYEAEHPTND